jgi:glucose-1-phosphate adenylyltransferase
VKKHVDGFYQLSPSLGHFVETILTQQKNNDKGYLGTADVVLENINELKRYKTAVIFVTDYVFTMDVKQMRFFHTEMNSSFTISAVPCEVKESCWKV